MILASDLSPQSFSRVIKVRYDTKDGPDAADNHPAKQARQEPAYGILAPMSGMGGVGSVGGGGNVMGANAAVGYGRGCVACCISERSSRGEMIWID